MAFDHSKTYKNFSLKNIPHIIRLAHIKNIIKKSQVKSVGKYADFGCSNGYITNIIANLVNPNLSFGFDHSDNLDIAQKRYKNITFSFIDLNVLNILDNKFDFITCFETLEHIGELKIGIQNLIKHLNNNGIIIISVPIEIGIIGIIKFLLKTFIYRYKLSLNTSKINYFKSLIRNKDISKFRKKSDHYGSHFGFNYKKLDEYFNLEGINYNSYTFLTTRFYIIRKFKA